MNRFMLGRSDKGRGRDGAVRETGRWGGKVVQVRGPLWVVAAWEPKNVRCFCPLPPTVPPFLSSFWGPRVESW